MFIPFSIFYDDFKLTLQKPCSKLARHHRLAQGIVRELLHDVHHFLNRRHHEGLRILRERHLAGPKFKIPITCHRLQSTRFKKATVPRLNFSRPLLHDVRPAALRKFHSHRPRHGAHAKEENDERGLDHRELGGVLLEQAVQELRAKLQT